jgi:hypothetical protein
LFQSNHYQEVFAQHQLADFDALWQKEIDWFERPNERRGGWSGVGTLKLGSLQVFVKKQQNHGRSTLLHPIKGEPTFRREFERLTFLAGHAYAAPQVVFYAESNKGGHQRAILITEALTDYVPLDVITKAWFKTATTTATLQRRLLENVASAVRQFHALGLVHRSLYPKHVFIKDALTQPQIALIDLEKARFSPLFWWRAYFDLATLNRHTKYWRRTQRLYFFMQYVQLKKLTPLAKCFCRLVIRRSTRN